MTTILIIDDDTAVLRNVGEMLELEGFSVIMADDGAQGLDATHQHRPDLIICDIGMPVSGGFDVLHDLREDSTTRYIPVIFITGMKYDPGILQKLQGSGIDYLFKPFTLTQMLDLVHKHVPC